MKTLEFKGIDYGFRPQSYQEVADPLATILLNVKGTNRRQMVVLPVAGGYQCGREAVP